MAPWGPADYQFSPKMRIYWRKCKNTQNVTYSHFLRKDYLIFLIIVTDSFSSPMKGSLVVIVVRVGIAYQSCVIGTQ